MEWPCQIEVTKQGLDSVLCLKPALILFDRRELGRLAVCPDCLNSEMTDDALDRGYTLLLVRDKSRISAYMTKNAE